MRITLIIILNINRVIYLLCKKGIELNIYIAGHTIFLKEEIFHIYCISMCQEIGILQQKALLMIN